MTIEMSELVAQTGYAHRWIYDKHRDVAAHEIRKSTCDVPYTVLIYHFSKIGHRSLFSDLYYTDSWDENRGSDGRASDDVIFCINLWKELGLEESVGEPFHPKFIEHDLSRYPMIYRRSLEEVMERTFGSREINIE